MFFYNLQEKTTEKPYVQVQSTTTMMCWESGKKGKIRNYECDGWNTTNFQTLQRCNILNTLTCNSRS